ncbi:MAG TPA: hypothetical protein DD473_20000 [Planctomycetaceae bacterium]|nr:hypothetical protein [Planctomycetaceae bacterium]
MVRQLFLLDCFLSRDPDCRDLPLFYHLRGDRHVISGLPGRNVRHRNQTHLLALRPGNPLRPQTLQALRERIAVRAVGQALPDEIDFDNTSCQASRVSHDSGIFMMIVRWVAGVERSEAPSINDHLGASLHYDPSHTWRGSCVVPD